jgi:hypothetical protein
VTSTGGLVLATSRKLAAPLRATRAPRFSPLPPRADEFERATLKRFHLRGSRTRYFPRLSGTSFWKVSFLGEPFLDLDRVNLLAGGGRTAAVSEGGRDEPATVA